MSIFGFGDNSDFKLVVKQDKGKLWHWFIRDEKGVARAAAALRGNPHGFATEEDAIADAREVVNGLGANFKDLDVIEVPQF